MMGLYWFSKVLGTQFNMEQFSGAVKRKLMEWGQGLRSIKGKKCKLDRHSNGQKMHNAIKMRDWSQIEKLIDEDGEDDFFCLEDGQNCFVIACDLALEYFPNDFDFKPGNEKEMDAVGNEEHWQILQNMIKVKPHGFFDSVGASCRDQDGTTILMKMSNSVEQIKFLVQNRAKVNDVDYNELTVLMHSYTHRQACSKAFRELLKLGASIEIEIPMEEKVRKKINEKWMLSEDERVKPKDFFHFMMDNYHPRSYRSKAEAVKMIKDLLAMPESWRKIANPISSVIEKNLIDPLDEDYNPIADEILKFEHYQPEDMLFKVDMHLFGSFESNWCILSGLFGIPNFAILDPLGYYFIKMPNFDDSISIEDHDFGSAKRATEIFMKLENLQVVERYKVTDYTPPLFALLYKNMLDVFMGWYNDDDRKEADSLGTRIAECFNVLEKYDLLYFDEYYTVGRILNLMVPFLCDDKDVLVMFVKLLSLGPDHPYSYIKGMYECSKDSTLTFLSREYDDDPDEGSVKEMFISSLEYLIPALVSACGHVIPVPQELEICDKVSDIMEQLLVEQFEDDDEIIVWERVTSLQDKCRWEISRTVNKSCHSSRLLNLPDSIKKLKIGDDGGCLPPSLVDYLLCYNIP